MRNNSKPLTDESPMETVIEWEHRHFGTARRLVSDRGLQIFCCGIGAVRFAFLEMKKFSPADDFSWKSGYSQRAITSNRKLTFNLCIEKKILLKFKKEFLQLIRRTAVRYIGDIYH